MEGVQAVNIIHSKNNEASTSITLLSNSIVSKFIISHIAFMTERNLFEQLFLVQCFES